MKLEIRLENGNPVIFFLDEVQHDKTITCYSSIGEHSSASRSYMRSLAKPETPIEAEKAWALLQRYAAHVVYTMRL